jgi:hypothetical protein
LEGIIEQFWYGVCRQAKQQSNEEIKHRQNYFGKILVRVE